MRGALKTMRTRVGRVQRDVQRQLVKLPQQVQVKGQDLLQRVGRIISQKKTKDKNKLYTSHAPEAECMASWPISDPAMSWRVKAARKSKACRFCDQVRSEG